MSNGRSRILFEPYKRGVWPEWIAIGLTVFVRREAVLRLFEFLGYRQEE